MDLKKYKIDVRNIPIIPDIEPIYYTWTIL